MKNEISSLDLYYLIKEFKIVEGSKIDRIYHSKTTPKELTISMHITGTGKKILRIILPGIIVLDDTKDSSDSQTGFGMQMRKYLEGLRVTSIQQKDFERVITITIEGKSDGTNIEKYYLIIELFSKGNIILCDNDMKILGAVEEQEWKDRKILRTETYLYPKSKTNILHILEDEFIKIITESDKQSIVKTLAITFNLGGVYSEEICLMSGIDKNSKINTITKEDCTKLYKNIILLLHKEIIATGYDEEIFPFEIESLNKSASSDTIKKFDNFNNAIIQNFDTIKHLESKKSGTKNLEKLQNIITEQTKLLEECQNGYEENQLKGELIYEKYQEIAKILETVKDARTKYSWKAIEQKIQENPELKKVVSGIDEQTNSIIINIEK